MESVVDQKVNCWKGLLLACVLSVGLAPLSVQAVGERILLASNAPGDNPFWQLVQNGAHDAQAIPEKRENQHVACT